MKSFLCVALLLISWCSNGQTCKCPLSALTGETVIPTRVYKLGNKTLGICDGGQNNTDTFEEFILFECGHSNVIGEWGALEPCVIHKVKDTLLVGELSYLPVGNNFAQKQVVFFCKQFFYKNNVLTKRVYCNKRLAFYSAGQIKKVFVKYTKLKKGNFDINTDVANMLFWAYVSGSKEAEIKFKDFKLNYRPFLDGGMADDWDIIWHNYENYKKINQ